MVTVPPVGLEDLAHALLSGADGDRVGALSAQAGAPAGNEAEGGARDSSAAVSRGLSAEISEVNIEAVFVQEPAAAGGSAPPSQDIARPPLVRPASTPLCASVVQHASAWLSRLHVSESLCIGTALQSPVFMSSHDHRAACSVGGSSTCASSGPQSDCVGALSAQAGAPAGNEAEGGARDSSGAVSRGLSAEISEVDIEAFFFQEPAAAGGSAPLSEGFARPPQVRPASALQLRASVVHHVSAWFSRLHGFESLCIDSATASVSPGRLKTLAHALLSGPEWWPHGIAVRAGVGGCGQRGGGRGAR